VDLSGHTNGGRLALFTRKPAPVQITAWGFAHGSGLHDTVDVFFADPIAVPQEERQYFAENIYDLPCIVTYEPPEYNLKATSPLPYYVNGEVLTFGSFSRFEKLSDQCLATFAEILRRVPDSRLYFKDHSFRRPYSIKRVRNAMPDVDPKRLIFGISTSHLEHLQTMAQCDLFLDTYPHGCGLVSAEILWAGIPLVTMTGRQPSGRTAASILTAMGRTDWIAKDQREYVELAVRVAGDIPALAKARKTLRQELLESPVVKDYRLRVEEAYRTIWGEYCGN
jgi:protein O-GlcNAc transferase